MTDDTKPVTWITRYVWEMAAVFGFIGLALGFVLGWAIGEAR